MSELKGNEEFTYSGVKFFGIVIAILSLFGAFVNGLGVALLGAFAWAVITGVVGAAVGGINKLINGNFEKGFDATFYGSGGLLIATNILSCIAVAAYM